MMLLVNHFPVGYIWILPTGGYEFGIFWALMCAVFVVAGGGVASLDHWLRQRYPRMPKWVGDPAVGGRLGVRAMGLTPFRRDQRGIASQTSRSSMTPSA